MLVHAGVQRFSSRLHAAPAVPLRGRLDSHSWTSCSIHRTARRAALSAARGKVSRRRSAHRCWTGTTRSRRPLLSVSQSGIITSRPPRKPHEGRAGETVVTRGRPTGIREPNDAAPGGWNAVGGLGRARRSDPATSTPARDRLYQVSPRRHSHRNRRAVVVGGPTALIVSMTRSICHPLRTPLAAAVSSADERADVRPRSSSRTPPERNGSVGWPTSTAGAA